MEADSLGGLIKSLPKSVLEPEWWVSPIFSLSMRKPALTSYNDESDILTQNYIIHHNQTNMAGIAQRIGT